MNRLNIILENAKKVKTFWKTPDVGKYMSYKEILSYSGGGIGVYFIIDIVNKMLLSTSNVLIGNTIGIDSRHLYFMYIIAVISSFPLTALRANIIDNTRSKNGKYRPFLIKMGIPCTVLAIAFVWIPYEGLTYFTKCVIILLFNFGFQFFFSFFREAYENLIHVLSPDSQERTNVLGIKSVIYSLAPSIINAITPVLAQRYFNNNMTDINLYRYIYPPIAIVGILLSVIVFVNTREKLILAKTHVVKVNFFSALKAVAKNKYFWIISLAGWLGFLEAFYANILFWLYQYQRACTGNQYGIIVTLYGNGSLWGMMFAPWAIKRFGKKKVLIVTNLFNIIFIACLYPSLSNIWIVLVFLYLNAIVGAFAHVLDPAIQGDIRDYQQYITGERIDGMFSAVGLIGSIVSMVTSSVLPFVYKSHGLHVGNGYENLYDILYDENVFKSLMSSLIMFSVVGAIMNVIPYFFYDLTETKQKAIVEILKIRAFFEDYANGIRDEQAQNEICAIISKARRDSRLGLTALDGNLKKSGKGEYRKALEQNSEIQIAKLVLEETEKYTTAGGKAKLSDAQLIFSMGLKGLTDIKKEELSHAKRLPSGTAEEKSLKKQRIALTKAMLKSKKGIEKYYPNDVEEFDSSAFASLFEEEERAHETLEKAYKAYYDAKKKKEKEEIPAAKAKVEAAKHELNVITHRINRAQDENAKYHRVAKPFLDSIKTIKQAQGYALIDELLVSRNN
ncbi:MAG TPA: MFS transporter [Clostridiales bacterium]|nr:MFS transporter [Clostridiales bacterium]